jgi:hypothetical protein
MDSLDFVTFVHPQQWANLQELARVENARAETFRAHARQRERRKAARRAKWEARNAG